MRTGQMIFWLLLIGMALMYFSGTASVLGSVSNSFKTVGYMLTNRLPNGMPAGYAR